jgi:hypothetical protein
LLFFFAPRLSSQKWKDEDIEQDLAVLNEVLEKDVNVLKYVTHTHTHTLMRALVGAQ